MLSQVPARHGRLLEALWRQLLLVVGLRDPEYSFPLADLLRVDVQLFRQARLVNFDVFVQGLNFGQE